MKIREKKTSAVLGAKVQRPMFRGLGGCGSEASRTHNPRSQTSATRKAKQNDLRPRKTITETDQFAVTKIGPKMVSFCANPAFLKQISPQIRKSGLFCDRFFDDSRDRFWGDVPDRFLMSFRAAKGGTQLGQVGEILEAPDALGGLA